MPLAMVIGVPSSPQPFIRTLPADAPRLPYRRRKGEVKTTLHWGQRKLLMSEVEFLTLYASPGDTVLYAGAAPGSHVQFLSERMFPELKFVLVDPADFICPPSERVEIRQEYFTSSMAREFAGRSDVLFISDIRTADPCKLSEMEVEEYVMQDNAAQMEWSEIIEPKKCMLKFRLPYPDRMGGASPYLAGDIFLPVWGPQTTTETRLVPTGGMRSYSHLEYEEQMFWFNTVYRESRWGSEVQLDNRGDNRYDALAEIHILRQFLLKRPKPATPQELNEAIATLSGDISRSLPGRHTLATRPLNKLLDERSNDDPFTQKPRQKDHMKRREISILPRSSAWETSRIHVHCPKPPRLPSQQQQRKQSHGWPITTRTRRTGVVHPKGVPWRQPEHPCREISNVHIALRPAFPEMLCCIPAFHLLHMDFQPKANRARVTKQPHVAPPSPANPFFV
eukprot:GGOE01046232.1.p1 GENE.GGOE01046232.1~~GGOE01046232.1.p1  ORF type:complete len:450 (-),score=69.58 GGOE01046232.1:86-1435(-)